MSVRTLNYTGRKRIRREDARIAIREEKKGPVFDAGLTISGYGLPADAHIFVEAYRQTHYMRFDFGRVGAPTIPSDRFLHDFESAEAILFRVKVVTDASPHGMLLAEADQIRPRKSADEEESRIGLLPVVPSDDIGDEIWRLEFDDQQTLLLINSKLVEWRAAARDPVFLSLVYPGVFRTILSRILVQEGYRDTDDENDWQARWLRFAVSLPGVGEVPGENEQPDRIDQWIDRAVSAFCYRHGTWESYERYWMGVQEQWK